VIGTLLLAILGTVFGAEAAAAASSASAPTPPQEPCDLHVELDDGAVSGALCHSARGYRVAIGDRVQPRFFRRLDEAAAVLMRALSAATKGRRFSTIHMSTPSASAEFVLVDGAWHWTVHVGGQTHTGEAANVLDAMGEAMQAAGGLA